MTTELKASMLCAIVETNSKEGIQPIINKKNFLFLLKNNNNLFYYFEEKNTLCFKIFWLLLLKIKTEKMLLMIEQNTFHRINFNICPAVREHKTA